MSDYRHLRLPSRTVTAAPPRPATRECSFCHSDSVVSGYCSACGTAYPTARSLMSIEALHRRGLAPRPNFKRSRPAEFVPDTGGLVHDDVVTEEVDELEEYSEELDELEDDLDDSCQDTDALLPVSEDLDGMPW